MDGLAQRRLPVMVVVLALAGCASVTAPKGTTLVDITATQTFQAPADQVATAASNAITQMGFTDAMTLPADRGETIEAVAGDRTVHIELARSGDQSTKVGVSVLRNGKESLADDAKQVIDRTGQNLGGQTHQDRAAPAAR